MDERKATAPVVLIAFNRPDLTARNVAALRAVRPERILVLCDGPRGDHPDDAARCAAVREAVAAIDWPTRVDRLYRDENLGCEANVELGLDWVFSQVDRAIVVEDDCIADPSFFRYSTELLERYRHDRRVWQIAGNSHDVPEALFGVDSYRFSSWASVWGWATWADRWESHRACFPRSHQGAGGDRPVRLGPTAIPEGALVTRAAVRHFTAAVGSTDVVTHGWDKHWWITMLIQGGLAVTPAHNLVENAGFRSDATHARALDRAEQRADRMPFPLQHPARVGLDREVERELELLLNRVGGRAARLGRTVVRSPALRRIARSAAHSAPVVGLTRSLSRMTDPRSHRSRGQVPPC